MFKVLWFQAHSIKFSCQFVVGLADTYQRYLIAQLFAGIQMPLELISQERISMKKFAQYLVI